MYGDGYNNCDFSELKGKTITEITGFSKDSFEIKFKCSDDSNYRMLHYQDCCEGVSVEDIIGDVVDLLNNEILLAEEVTSNEPEEPEKSRRAKEKAEREANGGHYYGEDSETWTFYKLSTIKGSVTIRWYGSSNGYYSESVDFEKLKQT